MNLKQKMRVLMRLFLALALILICPPDWHWEVVENHRWLERPWQQDSERYENECDKDSIVCHVVAHGENLNQLKTDENAFNNCLPIFSKTDLQICHVQIIRHHDRYSKWPLGPSHLHTMEVYPWNRTMLLRVAMKV